MYAQYADDFSPVVRIRYNGTTAAIAKGAAVARGASVYTLPDPAKEDGSITQPVFGIVRCTSAATGREQNFIGVANEAIPAQSWGQVCIGGPCEVLVTTSVTWTAGAGMVPGTTLGAFIASATPHAVIGARVLEAQVTTATLHALVKAFIEPTRLPGGGGLAYL